MTEPFLAGWFWVLLTVLGIIALAVAMVYATTMWGQRRRMREPGSLERAPGPAPKDAPPSDDDKRAA
jgi:uncharacterized iron-regulated membrane protein